MRVAKSYTESVVKMPVYSRATYDLVIKAETNEDVSKILREAKPINLTAPVKKGLFVTTPYLRDDYTDIAGTVRNVLSFSASMDSGNFVSEEATIRGIKGNTLHITMTDGEVRYIAIPSAYVFEV